MRKYACPYFLVVNFFSATVAAMMMPMIINTPSIPTAMYLRFSTNAIGLILSIIFSPFLMWQSYRKKPRTKAPAITDAI